MTYFKDSDLNDFEKRLKNNTRSDDQFFAQGDDSSEEEDLGSNQPKFSTEADILREKNRILMEKLFKADK